MNSPTTKEEQHVRSSLTSRGHCRHCIQAVDLKMVIYPRRLEDFSLEALTMMLNRNEIYIHMPPCFRASAHKRSKDELTVDFQNPK